MRAHSTLPALSCASRADVWVTFVFAARKLGRRHLTFLFVLQRIEKDERSSPSTGGDARGYFRCIELHSDVITALITSAA